MRALKGSFRLVLLIDTVPISSVMLSLSVLFATTASETVFLKESYKL